MTICRNLNLGLVIWDTEETFEDMRTITGSSNGFFNKPAWTALNNADNKSCTSAQNCNGKLVTWKTSKKNVPHVIGFTFYSCGSKHLEEAHNYFLLNLGTRMSRGRMTSSATTSRLAVMVMWKRRSVKAIMPLLFVEVNQSKSSRLAIIWT